MYRKGGYSFWLMMFSGLCSGETINPWLTEGMHGQFSVRGAVAHSACSVSFDSLNQTVDFGKIPINKFNLAESEVATVPFKIRIANCSLDGHARPDRYSKNSIAYAGGYTVLARFYGQSVDKEYPTLLDSELGIEGVGLQIHEAHNNRALPVNDLSPPLPLFKGDGELLFYASLVRYDKSKTVNTGNFSWNVTFEIIYQ